MLKRKVWEKLVQWKNRAEKKALCIIGARQVGKTTLVREFGGENYDNFVEINFMTDPKAAKIFAENMGADSIVKNLTEYAERPLEPRRTLILFDEIQECPNVRAAVKHLVEDGRFDCVETGALLRVEFPEENFTCLDFEEILYMYPMDFQEFLFANGVGQPTVDYLWDCFKKGMPVSEDVHNSMMKLFYQYVIVGGMPQIVKTFVMTHDIDRVFAEQKEILRSYYLDIARYAPSGEKLRIKKSYYNVPLRLGGKSRRFILTKMKGRLSQYENALKWLADAGTVMSCCNVSEPQPPFDGNERNAFFKLFMTDAGLLCAAYETDIRHEILKGNLEIDSGGIVENIVAQEIKSKGCELNYFFTKKYGEIHFVLQRGEKTELMEIKLGGNFRRFGAVDKVMAVEEWKFDGGYILCKGNVEIRGEVKLMPLYMSMFYGAEAM